MRSETWSGRVKVRREEALGVSARNSAKQEDLASIEFAREYLDAIAGEAGKFSKERQQSRIRPSFERRRMNGNLQLRRRPSP